MCWTLLIWIHSAKISSDVYQETTSLKQTENLFQNNVHKGYTKHIRTHKRTHGSSSKSAAIISVWNYQTWITVLGILAEVTARCHWRRQLWDTEPLSGRPVESHSGTRGNILAGPSGEKNFATDQASPLYIAALQQSGTWRRTDEQAEIHATEIIPIIIIIIILIPFKRRVKNKKSKVKN